jgi:mRNA interferase RelE/StbE
VYDIRILPTASRDLEKLDKSVSRRIVTRLYRCAANLEEIKLEALKGDLSGLYKLRVGDFRVIYEIIPEEQIIIIHQIGHRREIYRKR